MNKNIAQFKEIKKEKKQHYNYHLFSANFETYNFEKLKKEIEQNKSIIWKYSGNIKVEKGDIVYIYYFNLPDRINRILLKCTVIDAYKKDENEKLIYDEKKKTNVKVPAMLLSFDTALCVKENQEKFSEKNLRENYGINNFQGKQHIKENFLQEKIENGKQEYYQKKLIEDLENETKNKKVKLNELIEYIDEISQCALQKNPNYRHENHTTFVKENGFYYYEKHHLIQQFNGRKNEKLKDIIDNEMNLITLCPNCHRRIHHGKKKDRENMVEELYKKIKEEHEEFDNLLLKIEEIKNKEKTPIDWILDQYKLEKQDKDI